MAAIRSSARSVISAFVDGEAQLPVDAEPAHAPSR